MQADIAVVGGGLAGSLAAAMLGRAGHSVCLIDPHDSCPPEFRCEKLEEDHVRRLEETGLASALKRAGTPIDTLWIARFGRLIDKMPLQQYAMRYDAMVDAVKDEIPGSVVKVRAWADTIEASPTRPIVTLSTGQKIGARLVVLASGLNWSLRHSLGMTREIESACHSVALGFDLRRADGSDFDFPALQYLPERVGGGLAYLTLFRIEQAMRANLFLYLPLKDTRVGAFRSDPDAALRAVAPKLARLIGTYAVEGSVKIRPTDLHVLRNYEVPGVVLVGDAFATPCPVTGTGTIKVFNDVERLCNHHIPTWLRTSEMGLDKIGSYYRDPAKRAYDVMSASKAYAARELAMSRNLYWTSQRVLRTANRLVKWSVRSIASRRSLSRMRGAVPVSTPMTVPPS